MKIYSNHPRFKTNKLRFFLLCLLILLFFKGYSQETIDIGINEAVSPANTIEIKLRPTFTINSNDNITGILFTVRWADPTIAITANYVPPLFIMPAGPPILSNGYYYVVFAAVPFVPIGTTINAGSEFLIASFSYIGGACSSFEIVNDSWTATNNSNVYIEFKGNDATGIIYRPVANLGSIGGAISGGGTINLGQSTGSLILTGKSGSILTWQKHLNSEAWSDIPNTAGLTTYSETPASTGIWEYRAKIQRGACPIDYATPAQVSVVWSSTWTGSLSNDWFLAGNWSNGVPDADKDAVVPVVAPKPYPIISGIGKCFNLTIALDASLTITTSGTLTVYGNLTNGAGSDKLLIKSDASGTGSLIQNTIGVNATMERYIAGADWLTWNDGWHFLSSPVATQAVDPVFTTEPYDFYSWYEPTNEWVNYKNTSGTPWATANTISNGFSNNTANFLIGKGYMAAYDVDQTKSFAGELNVADVPITGLPITGSTGTNRSWHLLGNPFSSALTWSDSWTKTNIAGTAKIWKEINQSYSDLASSGAAIPATNGFMVQVNTAPGSLTIPASARVHSSQAFYKSSDQKMILTARNLDFGSAQESVVENNPNSTNGFDLEYDGEFLTGYAPLFFSEADNVHLSTNSLPLISSTTEIPFTFVKNEGTNFSIEAVGASTLAPEVWLMDKKTNTDHNLLLNPVYNFTATANDDPNRFVLHFGTVSVVDIKATSEFTVWYNEGRICFSLFPTDIQNLKLMDMAGRELVNISKPTANQVLIGSSFAKACYMVKITMPDAVVVKKIVIN